MCGCVCVCEGEGVCVCVLEGGWGLWKQQGEALVYIVGQQNMYRNVIFYFCFITPKRTE